VDAADGKDGGTTMLWTDEAVDILKRLAQEGRSASVIAAALGAPSRNAVIGKANRIGVKLNGGAGGIAPGERPEGAASAVPFLRLKPAPTSILVAPETKAVAAEVGEMRRVGFADIGEPACRWPLGDPRSGDFAYCGLEAAAGRSYCAGHCRMAYRPPKPRTSQSARERSGFGAFAGAWRLA
jgi:GcrA cell cycle regulator